MMTATPTLDRSTPVPLHHQVAEGLRAQIAAGDYEPGDLLPPETALAEELGLSRATVRQAIASLVQDGLLTRRRGIGTSVARPQLEQPLSGLYTFAELAAGAGRELATRVLALRHTVASESAARELELEAGVDRIVELDRLRLIDGAPLVLEEFALPASLFPDGTDALDFSAPLYDLLEQACGVRVTTARERIRPVNVDDRSAELLNQTKGAAAFHVERTGMAAGRPVEWRRSLICGDRYLYSVELKRASGAPSAGTWR